MAIHEVTPLQKVPRPPKRIMQTFRLPPDLVACLKGEAARHEVGLTAYVIRVLQGFQTDYGLPAAAVALLDLDREGLRLDRYEYLAHALFHRHLEIRENGPRFDAPPSRAAPKRPAR